jgi:two-component system, OmpR family, sensor kinase
MRVRMLAAVVVLLVGSSVVSLAQLRYVLNERLEEEVDLNLQKEVEEFQLLAEGTDPRTGLPFGNDYAALFDTYFAREVPDEGESLLAVVDGRLYRSARAEAALAPDELDDAVAYWTSLNEPHQGRLDTPAGDAHYAALPMGSDGTEALFVVANFPAYERAEIDDAVRNQAVNRGGTILLASLLGWFLAGRVLRPLRLLADTARQISETDLTRRIPVRGDDEASRIARAFNDMLARLNQAFTTQRQFLDDASHEFRAPLTVIRGHLDLLEMEDDPDERASTTEIIVNEIGRMNRMVEDLLTLARAERPGFLDVAPVEVDQLTHDVFRSAAVLCGAQWQLESTAGGLVVADAQRLTQALVQLAENACQHAGGAGVIRLGSAAVGDDVCFWVHDSGPGVPPGDEQRIFQRFVRQPGRRESSGLGLSIVAAIAAAHGGTASVDTSATSGARFVLRIPRVARSATSEPPETTMP